MSYQRIANTLYVHVSTVRRIVSRYNSFSDVTPTRYRPGPSRLLGQPDVYNVILEALLDRSNMYLHEIRELLFEKTGIQASITTIYRTLRRLGLTRKRLRRICMRQNDIRRREFMEEMSYIDPSMILWLDETGSDKRNARRTHGYHIRGLTPQVFNLAIRALFNLYHVNTWTRRL